MFYYNYFYIENRDKWYKRETEEEEGMEGIGGWRG